MAHKHPAIQQVYDLGYRDGETLHVRLIAGKGFDVKEDKLYPMTGTLTIGTWEFFKTSGKYQYTKKDGLRYLEKLNDRGYGVYLVVNKGGNEDADITEFTSLFFECDYMSKDEQWKRLERLPIEPSAVIDTRHSLHIYYYLDQTDLAGEDWRKYQQRLIQLMDSDRSIHNESRLMRLAGFNHMKGGAEPYPVTVCQGSGIRYSLETLDGLLPNWDDTSWAEVSAAIDPAEVKVRLAELKQRKEIVGDADFPLEVCLTKSDRDLINSGVPKGLGYNQGFKLACNLIATQEWLEQSGYRFTGNAEDLFSEFALRSSESYRSSSDIDKVLFNARKRASRPSLTPEAMENCILAWRKKQAGYNPLQAKAYKESVEKRREVQGQKSLLSRLSKFALKLWRSTPITTIKNGGAKQARLVLKEDYEGQIVEFKRGDGAKIYQEAGRLGYKYVLDCSPTGSGKTHTVGNLSPKSFFVFEDEEDDSFKRLIYFSQSPRNPNSAKIEDDFFEMPTRNQGFLLNYDKLTPGGRPTRTQIEDPDTEPELRTKATCHLAHLFTDCYTKGHDPKGICGGCEHFQKCRTERGDGYGYLSMTKNIKSQDKIHAHLRGIPEKLLDHNVVSIVDESEMAEWTVTVEVTERDLRSVFSKLKEANRELYRRLLPLKDTLSEIYDSENSPAPRWGWTMAGLMEKFADADLPGLDEYLEQIKEFEAGSRPEIKELVAGAELHQNFLYKLVAILTKRMAGSLSAGNKILTMTVRNQRMVDSLKDCHCTFFQDATHSREQLAIALGVPESEILVIRQESDRLENLTVKQYVGAGRLGNQRSKDELNRAKKIRKYFSEKYKDLGVIEFKAHSEPGDLIHGGDSRGSNAFQHKRHVLSLGLYRPNLGAVLNEYQAMTGTIVSFEDEGFCRYYAHKVAATVQQETGRLRANRRPGEGLTFHVVAEGDLSFLEELGIKVERIDIGTLDPEFGTIENRVKARNQSAAIAWVKEFGEEEWLKLSQNRFAYNLGVTASALSQWCKKYLGSFERFKQVVLAIMNPEPKQDEALAEADREEVAMLTTELIPALSELPLSDREFSEGFRDYIAPFKWENVLESINRLPVSKSLRLLFRIIRVCKGDLYATG
jgi:hypothetical protein